MRLSLILAFFLVWSASSSAGTPPTHTERVAAARSRVIRDPATGVVRSLLGLDLAVAGSPDVAARAAVDHERARLGLERVTLGSAVTTTLRGRKVVSFELLTDVAGVALRIADRRIAVTLIGDRARVIQSDYVPFEVPHSLGGVTALAAQETVHAKYRAPVGPAEPYLLVLGPGLSEPIWRLAVAVLPLADHRSVDLSRRSGRIVRESPLTKDGVRLGGVP